MAVRMKRPGKRVLALLGILAVFAAGCIGFTGCRGGSGDWNNPCGSRNVSFSDPEWVSGFISGSL